MRESRKWLQDWSVGQETARNVFCNFESSRPLKFAEGGGLETIEEHKTSEIWREREAPGITCFPRWFCQRNCLIHDEEGRKQKVWENWKF